MKKILLGILLILASITLTGCDCDRPNTWNVNEDDKWGILAEGEIIEFDIKRNPTCDKTTVCDPSCLKHGSYRYLTFNNGKTIALGIIKDPGLIKIGQTGKLYKYGDTSNTKAYFQWVGDKTYLPEATIIKKEIKPIIHSVISIPKNTEDINIINHEWRRISDIEDLKAKEIVLIKLNDSIITTGFITYDKQWKLGLNINKYNYGKTLSNVLEWKKLELE